MANVVVDVTLDETTDTLVVSIDPIKIYRDAKSQNIHWHLAGNAYGGEFQPLLGSKPGFSWSGPDPGGTFDGPTVSPKKKALTLKDKHFNNSSKGQWPYALRVKLNGNVYATPNTPPTVGGQDPIIKNN